MVNKQKWSHVRSATVIVCCLLLFVGCGGGSGSTETVVADAEGAAVDTPLVAGDWEVTLLKPPEKIRVVGSGNITYQAEGDFIVVFAKVDNQGQEMQVVGRDLFTLRDGQGQEYNPVKSAVQIAYVLEHGMQPSLDSPLAAGQARDSVIVFDVPRGTEDLVLGLKGTEESLDLGF
jgi:hypothetical protein